MDHSNASEIDNTLMKFFQQVRRKTTRLWRAMEARQISEEILLDKLSDAMCMDNTGKYWAMGASDEKWYVYNGITWGDGVCPYTTDQLDRVETTIAAQDNLIDDRIMSETFPEMYRDVPENPAITELRNSLYSNPEPTRERIDEVTNAMNQLRSEEREKRTLALRVFLAIRYFGNDVVRLNNV
jgi:hypothetical protein